MVNVLSVLVIAALISGVVWLLTRARGTRPVAQVGPHTGAERSDPKEVYLGLRNQALQRSRSKFSLPNVGSPTQPWGVLMDLSVPNGAASVMALADGNASIYLSTGGGFIGGIGQEPIRAAAQRMVSSAAEFQPTMSGTGEYPLPGQGQVAFYLLTDSGVYTTTASEDELGNQRLPLSKLFNAGQEVITQYRLLKREL